MSKPYPCIEKNVYNCQSNPKSTCAIENRHASSGKQPTIGSTSNVFHLHLQIARMLASQPSDCLNALICSSTLFVIGAINRVVCNVSL